MYRDRELTQEEKQKILQEIRDRGYPLHSPPHQICARTLYSITASCYKHQCYLNKSDRCQQLLEKIWQTYLDREIEIQAWIILPNHYHLLVRILDFKDIEKFIRLVHGATSFQWNVEESCQGRKIWYRYSDRAIRSKRHYYTTLNYIHYNPVKHRWVDSPYNWQESSVHWYLNDRGKQWLRDLWVSYPLRN
jgi:putative transposase